MIKRRCLGGCGRKVIPPASYCAACKLGTGWGKGRDTAAHNRMAREVLRRDCYRCTFAMVNGYRCPSRRQLVVHHTEPGNNDPAKCVTLCKTHHRVVDRRAR